MSAARLLARHHAVVYDLDGTLVDTLPDLTAALNAALAEHRLGAVSHRFVRDTLHGGLEASVQAALKAFGGDPAQRGALLATYTRHYAAAPVRRSRAYAGVREVLAEQCSRGVKLAVCTNKGQSMAERVLSALELRRFFSVIVGADTCVERKPHPAPLLHALAAMNVGASSGVLVGDSITDVQCARSAGVPCLLFTRGYGASQLARVPVAGRFARYAQLLGRAAQC